jgi:hypothetical protein
MPGKTYETHMKGMRVLPGLWRPHYPWEHIVWVSPPWPSQDYIWLDFPEAIFTSQGLLFLSHINPGVQAVYESWPRVEWEVIEDGVRFERTLPSGIRFGGSATRDSARSVALHLFIENGSSEPLKDITLQTCAFLRACKEFADYTMDNKLVHLPGEGWLPFEEAIEHDDPQGSYLCGWRRGRPLADWPYMLARSNQADRLVAMSWHEHTLSLVGNPGHPCLHADPKFDDLGPGDRGDIRGSLIFFEGGPDAFASAIGLTP